MKKLVSALALAGAAALVLSALASAAGAKRTGVGAMLTAQETVPAVGNLRGSGSFAGTLVGRTLTWKLTFSRLTGLASAAHIHLAPVGKAGNVVVPLCGPCKSGAHGKATLSSALVKAFHRNRLYVNVHTAKNPAGEIRGQLGVEVGTRLTAKDAVPSVGNLRGRGSFAGTLVGRTLTWKLTFSRLTGPATAAHIHLGAKGKAGNVVVPLCGPCKSGASGTATLSRALVKALASHRLYVNVHTAKNPAGEIRGQLSQ